MNLNEMEKRLKSLEEEKVALAKAIEQEKNNYEKRVKTLAVGNGYNVPYAVFTQLVNLVSMLKKDGYPGTQELFDVLMTIGENGESEKQTKLETNVKQELEKEKLKEKFDKRLSDLCNSNLEQDLRHRPDAPYLFKPDEFVQVLNQILKGNLK